MNDFGDGNHGWVGVQREAIVGLKPGELQLYLYLMASRDGGRFSQRSAAQEMGRSLDSVQRAIKELERLGLVIVDRTTPRAPSYAVDKNYVEAIGKAIGVPKISTTPPPETDPGCTENQYSGVPKISTPCTENQYKGVPKISTLYKQQLTTISNNRSNNPPNPPGGTPSRSSGSARERDEHDQPDIETIEAEVIDDDATADAENGRFNESEPRALNNSPSTGQTPVHEPVGTVLALFGDDQTNRIAEKTAGSPKKYRRPARGEYTDEFNAFWSLVTRKQAKADAARLFEEAVEEVGAELVIDRARQYYHLKQLEGTEQRYIKSGKNWLRDRLYEDDLTEDLQRAVLEHAQSKGSKYAGLVPSQAAVNDRLVEQYLGPAGPTSFAQIEEADRAGYFGNRRHGV